MDSEMNARRAVPNAVWAEGLKLRIITAWRRRSGDSDFKQAGQDHAGGSALRLVQTHPSRSYPIQDKVLRVLAEHDHPRRRQEHPEAYIMALDIAAGNRGD